MSVHTTGQSGSRPEKPGFIIGIQNYCDSWCARCPRTARCEVFALDQDGTSVAGARDGDNEEFWKRMNERFKGTGELLQKRIEECGMDSEEELDDGDAAWAAEPERRPKRTKPPLTQAAIEYTVAVHKWLLDYEDMFAGGREEAGPGIRIDASDADTVGKLRDALEVLRWYHTFIPAKIGRALSQRGDPFSTIEDDIPSDADGSAKVALIAMDRSIAAWGCILDHVHGLGDDIAVFLVRLDQLRRAMETTFPNARLFVRPGFDDEQE
ncbi:MAG: hypothetical protein KFH87_08135 [Bacteroidetes bacterium]|nr:hypothetical protein [Bacteroidota bacterium]